MTGSLDEAWAAHIHPDDRAATPAGARRHDRGPHALLRARRTGCGPEDGGWVWVHGKGSVVERDAEGRAAPSPHRRARTSRRAGPPRKRRSRTPVSSRSSAASPRRCRRTSSVPCPKVKGLELGRVLRAAHKAELVGGDFSDVFLVDEAHVAVLIGDVAGKGIRAAGLTETVRTRRARLRDDRRLAGLRPPKDERAAAAQRCQSPAERSS